MAKIIKIITNKILNVGGDVKNSILVKVRSLPKNKTQRQINFQILPKQLSTPRQSFRRPPKGSKKRKISYKPFLIALQDSHLGFRWVLIVP